MAATYPIELTQLEGFYLSDALSMFAQGPPDEAVHGAPYPNLLLKIGGAILETDKSKAPATVHLTLAELWVMREVAKSSVVIGNERVGLSLMLKAYEGLRALVAESDMQGLVGDMGEVKDDEPGKASYAARLAKLRDGQIPPAAEDGKEDGHENADEHDKSGDSDKDNADYHA